MTARDIRYERGADGSVIEIAEPDGRAWLHRPVVQRSVLSPEDGRRWFRALEYLGLPADYRPGNGVAAG